MNAETTEPTSFGLPAGRILTSRETLAAGDINVLASDGIPRTVPAELIGKTALEVETYSHSQPIFIRPKAAPSKATPAPPSHCPFCGSENQHVCVYRSSGFPLSYAAQCIDCGARGPRHRTMDEAEAAWLIRSIVRQCDEQGVSVFVKQLGANPSCACGELSEMKDKKGGDMAEWPADLRRREMPGKGVR